MISINSEYFLDAFAFMRVNANVKANDAVGNAQSLPSFIEIRTWIRKSKCQFRIRIINISTVWQFTVYSKLRF